MNKRARLQSLYFQIKTIEKKVHIENSVLQGEHVFF